MLILFLAPTILLGQTTIVSQVSRGSDDAEEIVSNGNVNIGSTDLELTSDGGTNQLVGIRFQNIYIPQGTTILSASIQFTTDETDSGFTSVVISAEATDNATTFSTTNSDISGRTLTTSVPWLAIPAWNIVGEAGANQQTPDLTAIVQQIVNRGGWTAGNSMAFIISGAGERTAESYNGDAANAPVLTIVADFNYDPLPTITTNPNKGLPFIYFMADNRSELYAVAPDPTASPLPAPTITNTTFGGSPIIFTGEGGGYRSTDRQVYLFEGGEPTSSSDMYSIDPTTGVATLVKTGIVSGHVEGAEFWINNSTGEEVMVIVYQNGTSGGADKVMAINPNSNGSFPAWTPYAGYPITLSGDRLNADGISWNPDTTDFYIQNDDNVDYYILDITTGVTTFAYTTSLAVDGEGITYASDGKNYIEDEDQAGQGRTIFEVETSTGFLTPAAQLGSTGDVESIMGNLGVRNDAGDAPSSYGYAAHILPVLTATPLSIYLGTIPPDSEDPFVNFSIGDADDNNGDDEDGVTSGGTDLDNQILSRSQTTTLDIVTNGSGVLNAWIDFNRDGDFDDAGEQIASDVSPSGGSITINVAVPITASLGRSYARFRYSSETGLASGNSEATDGEVEDYPIILSEDITCASGEVLVAITSNLQVNATAVIVDNSVGSQNNALGNDDSTTATFNSDSDQLILEMGEEINSGDSVIVNGEDGDDFDIWISSSATGPWTQVGSNAQLDFTFTSPINWLYIRLERGDSSGTENLSYIDASKSVISTICVPDTDGDGVPDTTDLDDDNDGILDTVENDCATNVEVNSPGYALNTALETGTSGSLVDLATIGTNNIDFNYTLNGTANWVNGVRIADDGGVVGSNTLYWQPNNTSNGNGSLTAEFVFDQPVLLQNITFGGLEFDDRLIFEAFDNSGNPITLTSLNFTTGGSVVAVGNDYTYVGLLQSFTSANYVNEIVSINVPEEVKRLVITSGKADGSNGNNTVEAYNFSYCTVIDTDGDGIGDYLETDSDGDGCADTIEAGFIDPDGDGVLGTSPVTVDANGLVSGQGGYTIPADLDTNSTFDFQEVGPDANSNGIADGCEADLELTKIVDNSNPNIGDTIIFTLTILNNGPSPASTIQVRDLLAPGLINVVATPSTGTYNVGTGIWDLNTTMNSGSTETLIIQTEVGPSCTTIINTAEIISSSVSDLDSTPNNGG